MGIETALLLMESVLLIFTVFLLVFSIREGRHRTHLIEQVTSAAKIMTRLEYFLVVSDSILEAKTEILGSVTGRRPASPEDDIRVNSLLAAIDRASARGVSIRYILPAFQDRLYMGYLYDKAGAEVRYSSCDTTTSLRYTIIDSRLVVIGLPEAVNSHTREGHRLPSPALAEIMRGNFESCWEGDATLTQFVRQVFEQTGSSIERMAAEFGIGQIQLEAILNKKS